MSLYTSIKEEIELAGLRIIREDSYQYPKGRSNIYAKDEHDDVLWFAELPMKDDNYCNPMKCVDGKITASTWKGFTVLLDPLNGTIISSSFTK